MKPMEKPVTKEQFDAFIAAYPNKLNKDVAKMFEPPMLNYNDFTTGKKWPESIVCWAVLNELTEEGVPNTYFIKD
jgi:hypothetical protein